MPRFRPALLAALLLGSSAVIVGPGAVVAAAAPADGPTWWKVDTHEHSAFSADARADLGVLAKQATANGYNAVFVTDHDRAASFQIQGTNGNYLSYPIRTGVPADDPLTARWTKKTTGSPTSFSNSDSSARYRSPSTSLHLQATTASATPARSMVYNNRGPSLRAGAVTLDFWVYPESLSAGSGVNVSMSLGGDSTTGQTTFGYTNAAGVTTASTYSKVLMWQLGTAAFGANTIANSLTYTQGSWNHYVINVNTGAVTWTPAGGASTTFNSSGLDSLPAADQPAAYVPLTMIKIEALAKSGTADAYFDDYVLKDAAPNCPAADFAYRNTLINSGQFNATDFALFPAREMGQNNHTNQFNFGSTDPRQYRDTFVDTTIGDPAYGDDNTLCAATNDTSAPWKFSSLGSDNIGDVQRSGYPAQTNHPGVTVTTATTVSTQAFGADSVEVRTGSDFSATWDGILQQDHVIVGTYGSDSHAGVSASNPANFIDAASLSLDDLMRSYFEGRMYMAPANFGGTTTPGRIVFTTDGSARPYPARYPVYVSSSAASANVHLNISSGLVSGNIVRWIYNSGSGVTPTDVTVNGSSYNSDFAVPLSGPFTYVRAEVRSSAGVLIASTEPIFFRSVANLPSNRSVHVESVTPTSGCSCSVVQTKGITGTSYSGDALAINLTNPSSSTVTLSGTSDVSPVRVLMDGATVASSTSLTAFKAQTGDAWFYDPATSKLYLQDKQSGTTSGLSIEYGSATTNNAPSVPTGLFATAGSPNQVRLVGAPSMDSDGSPLAGYHVFRGGAQVADITGANSFDDMGVTGGSTYSYTVSAYDTAGLESAQSAPVSVTTPPEGGSPFGTFNAVADSYVPVGDAVNHGRSTTLKTDLNGPAINSYLRFSLSGLGGSVITSAQLKIWALSSLTAGFSVRTADNSWTETGITAANAPAIGSAAVSSGTATAGRYVTVDVTSLLTGAPKTGDISLALVGLSNTGLSLASRENTNNNQPQLSVTTGNATTNGPPTVPTAVNATANGPTQVTVSWTAATDSDTNPLAGYHVFRDGTLVGTVTAGTSHIDTTVLAATTYSYTVSAYDTANAESAVSTPATVTTPPTATGGTFNAVADSYVVFGVVAGDPNHGTATSLKVDGDAVTNTYLRFTLSGLGGATVSTAQLKVWATSTHSTGFSVRTTSGLWTETVIDSSNTPAVSATGVNSAPLTAGAYVTVDISSLLVGSASAGDVDLALLGRNATGINLASRENAINHPPQLIITAGIG